MEKKYYFRGLGLGIIVTAVIMGIALSGGKKEKMTDAEIIARAKELGMIEDSTLLEASGEENAEDGQEGNEAPPVQKEDAVKKDIAVAKEKEEAEKKEETEKKPEPVPDTETPVVGTPESLQEKENKAAETEETGRKTSADTNEMTKPDEDVPKQDTGTKQASGGTKTVTISSGDGSYTVAKKLADAGVVSSADAYDDYLCANGYDKRLRTGTFTIPAHASNEQIARIVTGQE